MPDGARTPPAARVAEHRQRARRAGAKRVELTVPAEDASRLRAVAAVLRRGGEAAARVRRGLDTALEPTGPRTGREIVAFLRASPLAGLPLDVDRDRSPGRTADLDR